MVLRGTHDCRKQSRKCSLEKKYTPTRLQMRTQKHNTRTAGKGKKKNVLLDLVKDRRLTKNKTRQPDKS